MKHTVALLTAGLLTVGAVSAAEVDLTKLPPPSDKKDVTFAKDIKPIFEASCVRCHGGNRPRGGLKLDTLEDALKGGKDGKSIEPGDSAKSDLVIRVARLDPRSAMPPQPRARRRGGAPGGGPGGPPPENGPGGPRAEGGPGRSGGPGGGGRRGMQGPPPKPLTAEQVGLIRAWIDQGAK